jgi:cell division transport system permease protein
VSQAPQPRGRAASARDVPLGGGADRFVPLMIAPMAFLAALALVAAMIASGVVDHWDRGLAGSMTVEIPPQTGPDAAGSAARAAVAVLEAWPGVASATPVAPEEVARLLAPWLGDAVPLDRLPVPQLIDVQLAPAPPVDAAALGEAVGAIVPGARVDDHGAWVEEIRDLAGGVRAIAGVLALLIAFAAVVTVVFVTRAGLAIHHPVIDLLHSMGATDAYVARQFQRHALGLAGRGALLGLALAAVAVALISLAGADGSGLLPPLRLTWVQWLALCAIPAVIAVLAVITARVTVLAQLARLP